MVHNVCGRDYLYISFVHIIIICTYHYLSLSELSFVYVCDRNYKRSMEYLFYVPDPEHSCESDEILQIPEKGFKTADAYKVQNS